MITPGLFAVGFGVYMLHDAGEHHVASSRIISFFVSHSCFSLHWTPGSGQKPKLCLVNGNGHLARVVRGCLRLNSWQVCLTHNLDGFVLCTRIVLSACAFVLTEGHMD